MISTTNSRVYRPQAATLGTRRQVSTPFRALILKQHIKQICFILLAGIISLFAANYFLNINLSHKTEKLQQAQSIRYQLGNQNIGLLANRARLMSASHINEIAAEKYSLFLPDKDQIHRL